MTEDFPFLATETPSCPAGLLARAQALPTPRVALVNAGSEVPLRGLREAVELQLAEPILVGDRDKILTAADKIGWDICLLYTSPSPRDRG